ncbi:hypothetical protein GGS21DRAFT_535952 [Xylaria nigripes]|nr:hypothetical protein GGS21DRAFT_535952 [Xylaria nigripes]
MGTVCSIDKGAGSDEHGAFNDSQFPNSHMIHSLQDFADRHVGTNRAHLPNHRASRRRDKSIMAFKFQFQDVIVAGANARGNRREAEANRVIAGMRRDDEAVYKEQSLSPGDHFINTQHLLEKTQLFHVARIMPKGAHLHLHFNSTLPPEVLLGYAKDMVNMYVWSDHQLLTRDDLRKCKLEFSLRNLKEVRKQIHADAGSDEMRRKVEKAESLSSEADKIRAYDELGPNMFRSDYKNGRRDKKQHVEEMRYQYFRECWNETEWGNCDTWLVRKLTFNREEVTSFFSDADGIDLEAESDTDEKLAPANPAGATPQKPSSSERDWRNEIREKMLDTQFTLSRKSARKAWRAFNGRTKMMKGLFNYETAFRQYTRRCLEEFVKDNVQYAEIRPNFMQTNQILNDTAEFKIDNFGTMKLIVKEYDKFMKDVGDMGEDGKIADTPEHRPTFSGMKVIYCTPRSFNREAVAKALDECIEMKKTWPQYIAGFDLVGEEAFAKPFPLRHFSAEFKNFRKRCEKENLKIPFLFHCGETPDDLEGNLETALEFDSKRIGHGYALPTKMNVLREMRKKNVCVEACPISNMVLGLAARMDQHSMYRLLEENMHCALSSDNGTLFMSTLSHDFYEAMVGNEKINLYGWKQLARWSIEHACLSQDERKRAVAEWEKRWEEFISDIIEAPSAGPHSVRVDSMKQKADAIRTR